jgi:hypothetical protein
MVGPWTTASPIKQTGLGPLRSPRLWALNRRGAQRNRSKKMPMTPSTHTLTLAPKATAQYSPRIFRVPLRGSSAAHSYFRDGAQ